MKGTGWRTRPPARSRFAAASTSSSPRRARGVRASAAAPAWPAGGAAGEDRRAAGIELDLLDEVGVDDAGAVEQVVEHRHAGAVEQKPGCARGRAAPDGEGEERPDGGGG